MKSPLHTASAILALTAVYVLAGRLGLALALVHPSASVVWPPTGIALAALLLWGRRMWPAVAIGAFLVNFSVSGLIVPAGGIAVGNTLEAVVGAHLATRFANGTRAFERPQDVFKFAALSALIATMISAWIGVLTLLAAGLVSVEALDEVWMTWWLGDVAGALIVAPAAILWIVRAFALPSRPREGLLLFSAVVAVGIVVFVLPLPLTYVRLPFEFVAAPLLVWAALRFGPRETATTTLILAAFAIWGTFQGLGPFARANVAESLILLQAFMAVYGMTSLVLAADVVQRRRAETELRSTEEQLRLIDERRHAQEALAQAQAIAHLGSWEWNVRTDVVTWSDEMYRVFGLEPGAFPATYQGFLERIHPDDVDRVAATVANAQTRKIPFELQHRIVRPDGAVRVLHARGEPDLDGDGAVVRMVGTGHDITELVAAEAEAEARKAAERAAARTAQLQKVTASLSNAITPGDVLEVMVNEGIAALGADAGSIVLLNRDQRILEVVLSRGYPEPVVEQWNQFSVDAPFPIAEAARHAAPVWIESRIAWADRYPNLAAMRQTEFEAAAAIPLLAHNRCQGAIGLSFREPRPFSEDDRTMIMSLALQCALALERARLFETEQEARTAAEVAIRARDEFLSVAAHELRTPLTSLRLYAQHLLRVTASNKTVDPEQLRASLKVFDSQSLRLTKLVSQLLDVSRIEAGRLQLAAETVDLARLVNDVVERARLNNSVREIRVTSVQSPLADVDSLRIEQVVTNLLDNAFKYSRDQGPIDVSIERADDAGWEIAVRDHGVGIAPEHRDRIFDRFYQADALHHSPGLGLGLYVSRQIVELHGGELSVQFPSDGGCRFVVRLPASSKVPA